MSRARMSVGLLALVSLLTGCSVHQYALRAKSDTDRRILARVMRLAPGQPPECLFSTELTEDREFSYDAPVRNERTRVEAWFEVAGHPETRMVLGLRPNAKVRVEIDFGRNGIELKELPWDEEGGRDDH